MWSHVVVLVGVLGAHGTKTAAVAEQGCWAIRNLATDAANATALVSAGASKGELLILQ